MQCCIKSISDSDVHQFQYCDPLFDPVTLIDLGKYAIPPFPKLPQYNVARGKRHFSEAGICKHH